MTQRRTTSQSVHTNLKHSVSPNTAQSATLAMCLCHCRVVRLTTLMLAIMFWTVCTIPGLQAAEQGPYESEGTVLGIVADQGLILLDHEPIRAPGYFMGPMEMPFSVSDPALIDGLKAGDRVYFRVSEEKKSRIVAIRKLP
jgi:Cu/Ag efflux protein CusF